MKKTRKKNFFKKKERPDFYHMLTRQCEITSRSISLLLKYISTGDMQLAEQIESCEKNADKVRRDLIDYGRKLLHYTPGSPRPLLCFPRH